MSNLYPLKLEPKFSQKLWGGGGLADFLNLEDEGDEPLGEVWLVYAENRVTNGDLTGKTLAEVAETHGADLLGSLSVERYGTQFPLLAKFIGADKPLSIQVHPDDAYAKEHEAGSGYLGKTEAWVILEAKSDATIIWGFKDEMTKEEVRRAIEEERLEPHLNVVPISAGDVIYNPAGTLHAIGAGTLLFEIQQSSDLTYRLYDYGRRDASGSTRELHVDKALDVLDLTAGERAKVESEALTETKTQLLWAEHFAAERWQVSGEQNEEVSKTSLEILTATEGEMKLRAGGEEVSLSKGETVVLPASLGEYVLSGEGVVLRCFVPELR